MFRLNNTGGRRLIVALSTGLLLTGSLFAQDVNVTNAGEGASVLRVYFVLLVFATIISRLLQIVKLFYRWLAGKWTILRRPNEWLWKIVKRRLDRWGFEYEGSAVRQKLDKGLTAFYLHTLGFAVGVAICVSFNIGALQWLGWQTIPDSLNYILTGILTGAGIDPVHAFFRFAEEKKEMKRLLNKTTATSKGS